MRARRPYVTGTIDSDAHAIATSPSGTETEPRCSRRGRVVHAWPLEDAEGASADSVRSAATLVATLVGLVFMGERVRGAPRVRVPEAIPIRAAVRRVGGLIK